MSNLSPKADGMSVRSKSWITQLVKLLVIAVGSVGSKTPVVRACVVVY